MFDSQTLIFLMEATSEIQPLSPKAGAILIQQLVLLFILTISEGKVLKVFLILVC